MFKLMIFSLGFLLSANSALAHQLSCAEEKYVVNFSVKSDEVQIEHVKIQNEEKFVADVTESVEGELTITLIDLDSAGALFLRVAKEDLLKVDPEKKIQMAVELLGGPGTNDITVDNTSCAATTK